ncbi:MAG: hypothetical protein AAF311_09920 [Pseudomonadota bacterium]
MADAFGNTVRATFRDDTFIDMYFEPGGGFTDSLGRSGDWGITDDGQLCLHIGGISDCNTARRPHVGDVWEQTDTEGNWARISVSDGRWPS